MSEAAVDDRENYIEDGRMAALRLFRPDRQYGESPLAYFDGAHRPPAPRRTKSKPRHQVMHAIATRPSGTSRPALINRQEMHGYVRRAIAELDPFHSAWIEYRYRQAGLSKTQRGESFIRAYFEWYNSQHLKGCKSGTRRMCRYLIAWVMSGNRGDPQPQGADINRENWLKTYQPHYRRIRNDIAEIDADALYNLGVKLSGK